MLLHLTAWSDIGSDHSEQSKQRSALRADFQIPHLCLQPPDAPQFISCGDTDGQGWTAGLNWQV